jgi:hypothetical protein
LNKALSSHGFFPVFGHQQALVPATLPSVGKVGPVNGHGEGLTPALPSSVEPIGIVPIPSSALELGGVLPGDEVLGLLELDAWLHVLAEAALVVPIPIGDMPVAVPRPPPSYSPVDAGEGTPTTTEQTVNPVLGGAGLSPGVASSVAPRGTPAGSTGPAAELMPNGDVTPIPGIGLPIPATWAKTGLQPRSVARKAAISSRRMVASITDDRIIGF